MKATVATKELLSGLDTVAPAAKRNAEVIPVIGAVRLAASDTGLMLVEATNFELEVTSAIPAEDGATGGEVLVLHDVLHNFVRTTPDDTLELVVDDSGLYVRGDTSRLTASRIMDEWPGLSSPPQGAGIDVDWSQVARVAPFCAGPTSQQQPVLRSVHVAGAKAVGCDSHRFAIVDLPGELAEANLPAAAVRVAQGSLHTSSQRAWFVHGSTVYSTPLTAGAYPDVQSYLDKYDWKHTLTVDRAALVDALAVVKGTMDSKSLDRRVTVAHEGTTLRLSCQRDGNCTGMDVPAEGDPFDSGFNLSFLEEFAKSFRGDTLALQHGEPDSMVKAEEDGFVAGLMRLRTI